MDTLERGKVKFFDSRDEKRFGFLLLPSGEEVFFHFNDGGPVEAGPTQPLFRTQLRPREPRKGDTLVFLRSSNRKGPKAAPWGFVDEYEQAEKEIDARPVYRLMKQEGGYRGKGKTVVVWEGHWLAELREKHSSVRLGLHWKEGTSQWAKHWFEARTADGWERHLEDLRNAQPTLEKKQQTKPKMPFAMAKRDLMRAKRNGTILDRDGLHQSDLNWTDSGNRQIATALSCRKVHLVTTMETGEYAETEFEEDESKQLIELGQPGRLNVFDENYEPSPTYGDW